MRRLVVAFALLLAGPVQAGEIMVMDAYARIARPGAPTGAIFMVLHNAGDRSDRLIGAASSVAEVVQLHTHINQAGVVKMRQIETGIPLGPGAMHEMARGGDHVMLMGLTADLEDGQTIPVTLTFEVAGKMTIDVVVDSARGQAGTAHKH